MSLSLERPELTAMRLVAEQECASPKEATAAAVRLAVKQQRVATMLLRIAATDAAAPTKAAIEALAAQSQALDNAMIELMPNLF